MPSFHILHNLMVPRILQRNDYFSLTSSMNSLPYSFLRDFSLLDVFLGWGHGSVKLMNATASPWFFGCVGSPGIPSQIASALQKQWAFIDPFHLVKPPVTSCWHLPWFWASRMCLGILLIGKFHVGNMIPVSFTCKYPYMLWGGMPRITIVDTPIIAP